MERSDDTEVFAGSLPPLGSADRVPVLLVQAGASAGMVFPLTRAETTVGRGSQSDIVLKEPGVSRAHARFLRHADGAVEVVDLGSANGVSVEGHTIAGPTRLVEGQRIGLGPTAVLKFELQDDASIELAARMFHGASKDNLTFALTRRQFMEQAQQEDSLSRRSGLGYCLLLIDVDRLRRVNEAHGTPAGDSVIRGLVARIRGAVRPEDLVARFEGGLLALLLRQLDVAGASTLAERIRQSASQSPFGLEEGSTKVTVTIGLADGKEFGNLASTLAAAEKGLAEAKKQGPNRVYHARP